MNILCTFPIFMYGYVTVLDRNIWNHIIVCKLFVLNRNVLKGHKTNQLTNDPFFIKRIIAISYNNGLIICIENYYFYKFTNIFIIISYLKVSKVGDLSRGWPKGSLFDSYYTKMLGGGATPFPGLLHFTLDHYLVMLSVKQGGIKTDFLSLWYDSTWDLTQSPTPLAKTLLIRPM